MQRSHRSSSCHGARVAVEVEVEVWPSLRDLLKPVRHRLSHLPASLQPHIVASWRSLKSPVRPFNSTPRRLKAFLEYGR